LKEPLVKTSTLFRSLALVPLMALSVPAAMAADQTAQQSARARFEQDRAVCNSGRSNQDRKTCMQEANAALAAAQGGRLPAPDPSLARNATKRCAALPVEDRKDCEARMRGQGTTSGSAADGGIYRELVTRTVGPVENAASAVMPDDSAPK
jgi:hypothetical protein